MQIARVMSEAVPPAIILARAESPSVQRGGSRWLGRGS
jgi:hypothetical protein